MVYILAIGMAIFAALWLLERRVCSDAAGRLLRSNIELEKLSDIAYIRKGSTFVKYVP